MTVYITHHSGWLINLHEGTNLPVQSQHSSTQLLPHAYQLAHSLDAMIPPNDYQHLYTYTVLSI
jgi:hypothetical protein